MPRTADPAERRATRNAGVDSLTFQTIDSSVASFPASKLIRGALPRDVIALAARLAADFARQNQAALSTIGATLQPTYDGSNVRLFFTTNTSIGAVPLRSPTTGLPEYVLAVRPRFEWRGIGGMLAEMGWRIIPQVLQMPLLPKSDREIPEWVLSTIVLARIEALLHQLERRFEFVEEDRRAPRGSVRWERYVGRVATGSLLNVPCRYPDLRDDAALRAGIRYVLASQRASLQTQSTAGHHVRKLIEWCGELLDRVLDVIARRPAPRDFDMWIRGGLKSESFRQGIEGMQWSVEQRGLAGASDLRGLPWVMRMDEFFEAWTETVLALVAQRIGGQLRIGRERTTLVPLAWQPAFLGSQGSLVPDLLLDRGDLTIIVDAKYKRHWEEMSAGRWTDLEVELRERHRADLLQVLAYANLSTSPRTVVCLAYPSTAETWRSLQARGRLFHRATLNVGTRALELVLTAFPMGIPAAEHADHFVSMLNAAPE